MGILTAIKFFLKWLLAPVLYGGGIFTALVTVFKRAEWGLFLLVAMIPQPNIWYKLHGYPLGKSFIDILFFAILIGIVFQQKGFTKTNHSTFILFFVLLSYLSLWNSSIRFSLPLPLTTSNELLRDWKNYAEMILLYFLVLNVIKTEEQQKTVVVLMSVVILLIAIRSYRDFSGGESFDYSKRVGGPFEAVGLGANHFGAFIAHYCVIFLGLFFFDNDPRRRLLFIVTYLFGLHPLFFSYSRGAYLGALGAFAFIGLIKKRSLLVVVAIILLAWKTLLPISVVDRIEMTETENGQIESSAAHRLDLWKHAMDLFEKNPIFGIGFGGFGFTVPPDELTDTHNFYMKTLSEQGIIGSVLLFILLFMCLASGWRLFKVGLTPFHKGLGLGFMGAVVACMITNMFGDRWSYLALGGYFWVFLALVDRGILISQDAFMHARESEEKDVEEKRSSSIYERRNQIPNGYR